MEITREWIESQQEQNYHRTQELDEMIAKLKHTADKISEETVELEIIKKRLEMSE